MGLSLGMFPSPVYSFQSTIQLKYLSPAVKLFFLLYFYYEVFVGLFQTIATTLKRDENGLGFSIAGGHGSPPFNDSSEEVSMA